MRLPWKWWLIKIISRKYLFPNKKKRTDIQKYLRKSYSIRNFSINYWKFGRNKKKGKEIKTGLKNIYLQIFITSSRFGDEFFCFFFTFSKYFLTLQTLFFLWKKNFNINKKKKVVFFFYHLNFNFVLDESN